jgi:hypothetical protein
MKKYFYNVDFMSDYDGKHYFRLISASTELTHAERMAHFDKDLNGSWVDNTFDPQYSITAYELDMDDDEMVEAGLKPRVLHDTYWDTILQGAA